MDTRTNTIEMPRQGSWKLATCASLALLITLLSASVINNSVLLSGAVAASQPSVALQAATALPTVTVAASR